MIVTIHQPEHLPWLGFLHKVSQAKLFVVLDNVAFRKNYFQNRNRIAGPRGPQWLTVPVLHHGVEDKEIKEIRVNDSAPWRRKYVATLQQTYAKHPFATSYIPRVAAAIEQSGDNLAELNMAIIRAMFGWFDLCPEIVMASSLGVSGSKTDLLVAICKATGATTYLSGPSGTDYLDEAAFQRERIEVVYEQFEHPTYPQRGGGDFVPYLSAIDALANVGPAARALVVPPV